MLRPIDLSPEPTGCPRCGTLDAVLRPGDACNGVTSHGRTCRAPVVPVPEFLELETRHREKNGFLRPPRWRAVDEL
jgi:hypothetical protein